MEDHVLVNELIERFSRYDQPALIRMTVSLLQQMRSGEIEEGDTLPTNRAVMGKSEENTPAAIPTYAKQFLGGLGLTYRYKNGYRSAMRPEQEHETR